MNQQGFAKRNSATLFRIIQLTYVVALLVTIHTLIDNDLPVILDVSTVLFVLMGFVYAFNETRRILRTHQITPTSFFYIQSPVIAMNVSHILFWICDRNLPGMIAQVGDVVFIVKFNKSVS